LYHLVNQVVLYARYCMCHEITANNSNCARNALTKSRFSQLRIFLLGPLLNVVAQIWNLS